MKLFRVFALWLFRDVFESFISKSVINYLDSCCIAEIFWWERIIMMTETGMQIREGQWIWHFRLSGYWSCICPGDDSASLWRQNVFEGKMSIQMQSLKTLPKVNFWESTLFKAVLKRFCLSLHCIIKDALDTCFFSKVNPLVKKFFLLFFWHTF